MEIKYFFKNRTIKKSLLFLIVVLIFNSCSNTKYLSEGEQLYTGAEIELISEDETPDKSELINELQDVIQPKPNTTLFGVFRPKLAIYNWVGEPKKEKGVRAWIRQELGEPPVLFSEVPISANIALLTNRLENHGYFTPLVTYNINKKNSKVSIDYTATIEKPYTIKSISYPTGSSDLKLRIREYSEYSLLQPGQPYNLQKLIEERIRIDSTLKNLGYFYFNPDYIIFRVDSSVGSRDVSINVDIKNDIPSNARIPYVIKSVIVNTNYSIETEQLGATGVDTSFVSGMFVFDRENDFRPGVFKRTVFLRSGQKYSRRKHEITLNHLMGLGTFQFVNIRFADLETQGDTGKLNAYINLTPIQRRAVRLELSVISKSNNFAGPGLSASYRNRNLFKGAELLIVNLNGNYETLISGRQKGLNSYELGVNSELHVPRFIAPFNVNPDRPISFIPKTKVVLGYKMLNRVQFFWLNSFNASFGYIWRESRSKTHELNPVSLNYIRLGNESEQFREILARNPVLRRSFEDQLIFGSVYIFTYNDQLFEERKNNYFFRTSIDVAGNSMHLAQLTFREDPATEELPYTVLGIPYSQYVRAEADLRYFFRVSPKSRIATRLVTGAGYAYTNARTLPYVKQFFIGGANSIRAFLPRSLGPGTFRSPLDSILFLDQTGDMKLEGNLEYRFPIVAMLKGAVFLDAGNIWTFRKGDNPSGQFFIDKFYKQIAVGSGFGLRVDVDFFVLRLDLGIPLREPFQPEGKRWVVDEIDFGSSEWRSQRLVLNIAIGYPF